MAFKGSLASTSGNRFRLELNGEFQAKPAKILKISDGTHIKTIGPGQDGAQVKAQDTPKKLDEMIRAAVTRTGVFFTIYGRPVDVEVGVKPKEFKIDEQMPVSDFRLGKAENVGEREAQVVDYKIT